MNVNVIIVEDNQTILGIMTQVVEDLYAKEGVKATVIGRDNADAAIQIIRTVNPAFDVVFTDFRIPARNEGLHVAAAAKERDPETYVAGMSSDVNTEEMAWWKIDTFMAKPLPATTLHEAVRKSITKISCRRYAETC